MSGFCRWYDKDMEDVTKHEQERCWEKRAILFQMLRFCEKGAGERRNTGCSRNLN